MAQTSAFSRFFSLFNPVRAIRDFKEVWMQENPYRWRVALVALVATVSIFSIMFQEEHRIEPRAPEITWISTLDETRTDEEIMASNIANQEEQDRLRAEREQLEAEKREIYEAIGRASGIDVEAARAEGEAERAAQAKAEEEARQRALAEIEARQN
ncbi:hypothetical protein [Croceicoccus gelatinilyticus]|uniref:hypothetical protein n=1 Tax=Croceicoccus gelatinilyticus TaxID=2835536 RepID=UPI001BCC6705|nr:hypothetical protein [Croceicoccus gelatinilyticus]MBS7671478.1 hypothetical protein [Croceicoccus gelatinilyticus]